MYFSLEVIGILGISLLGMAGGLWKTGMPRTVAVLLLSIQTLLALDIVKNMAFIGPIQIVSISFLAISIPWVLILSETDRKKGVIAKLFGLQLCAQSFQYLFFPPIYAIFWALAPFFVEPPSKKPRSAFFYYQTLSTILFCLACLFSMVRSISPGPLWNNTLLTLACWIRLGLFPFHTSVFSMLEESPVIGIPFLCSQMGILFLEKTPSLPVGVQQTLLAFAYIGLAYFSLLTLIQSNLRRMLALVSLSLTSFAVLGLLAKEVVTVGNHFQWFSTVFITAGLGAAVYLVKSRVGDERGGLASSLPGLATFFLLFGLAASGLPGSANFISLELLFEATSESSLWLAGLLLAAAGTLLVGVYLSFSRVFLGPAHFKLPEMDILPRERAAFLLLLASLVIPFLATKPLLDWIGGFF